MCCALSWPNRAQLNNLCYLISVCMHLTCAPKDTDGVARFMYSISVRLQLSGMPRTFCASRSNTVLSVSGTSECKGDQNLNKAVVVGRMSQYSVQSQHFWPPGFCEGQFGRRCGLAATVPWAHNIQTTIEDNTRVSQYVTCCWQHYSNRYSRAARQTQEAKL